MTTSILKYVCLTLSFTGRSLTVHSTLLDTSANQDLYPNLERKGKSLELIGEKSREGHPNKIITIALHCCKKNKKIYLKTRVQLFFVRAGVVYDESALTQITHRATPTLTPRLEPAAQKKTNPFRNS